MSSAFVMVGPDDTLEDAMRREQRAQLSPDTRAILEALDRIEALLKEPRTTINIAAGIDVEALSEEVIQKLQQSVRSRL